MIPQPPLRFGAVGEDWPSGRRRVAALLNVEDRWVATLVDVPLMSDFEDGLGPWVGACGRLPSGMMVELIRYTTAPVRPQQYELRCDFDANPDEVLAEFASVTELDSSAVFWSGEQFARPGGAGG